MAPGRSARHAFPASRAYLWAATASDSTRASALAGARSTGGNVKLADVGPWLRDKILDRFKQVRLPLTIKYIDPTYMIRAVKPNAHDSVYCAVLADNAVHAAMAGYTGVTIGKVCERYVMLPIQARRQRCTWASCSEWGHGAKRAKFDEPPCRQGMATEFLCRKPSLSRQPRLAG